MVNSKKNGSKKKARERIKSKEKPSRCRLLELPPELRNRIYHFPKEQEFESDGIVPPIITRSAKDNNIPAAYSGPEFISLTQTCTQIRNEYRILWLRNSSIRIKLEDIQAYVTSFYPTVEDYQNAPKLVLISWDHESDGYDEDVLFDISLLLRLRAFCPKNITQFVCRRLVDFDLPDVDRLLCARSIKCMCRIDCSHEDTIYEVMFDVHIEYHYMMVLNELLANSNEKWLKALRNDSKPRHMRIECTIDVENQHLMIYIRFHQGTHLQPSPRKPCTSVLFNISSPWACLAWIRRKLLTL